jgi:hypothetical protein
MIEAFIAVGILTEPYWSSWAASCILGDAAYSVSSFCAATYPSEMGLAGRYFEWVAALASEPKNAVRIRLLCRPRAQRDVAIFPLHPRTKRGNEATVGRQGQQPSWR